MSKWYNKWTRVFASVIGSIAPKVAINYIRSRNALATYSAATKSGPNQAWLPTNKSADEIIKNDHALIRARSRALIRDSSHVSGAIRKICNNVIYKGIAPQAKYRGNNGELKENINKRAEKIWKRWEKEVGFREKERLVLRHQWEDGELFVHYFYDDDLLEKGVIPLNLEILECDHLDTSRTGANGNNAIKQGIEYNPKGVPVAYWLFPEHPGDATWLSWSGSKRYPAENVEHIFVRERASQNRGVPWLTPVIMEMRDFSEYQQAERIAARLAAAFGIFVTTPYPEQYYGNTSPIGGDGEQITSGDIPDYLEPGRIQPLPPGMDIKQASNERPGSTYEPFTKTTLRGASTGVGISYEAYSNDYTDASYASARSASLEERRGYQVQQSLLIRMFHQSAWDRVWGMNRIAKVEAMPEVISVIWQTPGWPWVDPDKDSKAAERDIKNGLNSRHKVCMERGTDYEEIIDDLQREQEDGFPINDKVEAENANANAE